MNAQLRTLIITYPEKNKVYNIEIDPNTKVQELIAEFQEVLQLSGQEEISFMYLQKRLEPDLTFEQQQVKKGAQIELMVKRRGGV